MKSENTCKAFFLRLSCVLQDDAQFVKECVARNGLALEYASKRLKMNMMVVETAIKQNPNALIYASSDVRHDPGHLSTSFCFLHLPLTSCFAPFHLR
jgi:hypothetical protein